ncbi:MAG: lipocalin family protein [Bacteroidaceae bacterium]|nr:lipocalin family protein [Bacteroidaceae bacterium]
MKKLFYFTTLLLFSVVFVSCSNDDDNEPTYTEAQVVGNWRITEVKVSEGDSYTPWLFEETGAVFMEGGDYLGYGYFGSGIGTWNLSGKVITTYVDGKTYLYYEILNISNNTCELKMGEPGTDSKIWIRCKKI